MNAGATVVANPRLLGNRIPTFWISWQTATHRRHRMHFAESRRSDGEDSSTTAGGFSALVRDVADAELVRQCLQLAVEVAGADGAVHLMVGEQKLDDHFAGFAGERRVGLHDEPFGHREYAGGDEAALPLHFHAANAARTDCLHVLQVAQGRYVDVQFLCGLEHGNAFFHRHVLAVDIESYRVFCHLFTSPF